MSRLKDRDISVATTYVNAGLNQVDFIWGNWHDFLECSESVGEYRIGGCEKGGFLDAVRSVVGSSNVRLAWISKKASGTSEEEYANSEVVAFINDIDTMSPAALGAHQYLDFDNAANDSAYISSAVDLSFGSGHAADMPFSSLVLLNPDSVAGVFYIISKFDVVGADEYTLYQSGDLLIVVFYHGADTKSTFKSGVFSAGEWVLIGHSYPGSGDILLYKNGLRLATSTSTNPGYSGMDNENRTFRIGAFSNSGAPSPTSDYDGKIAFVMLFDAALSDAQMGSLKNIVNSYYGLLL
jgi:hypothetical protein